MGKPPKFSKKSTRPLGPPGPFRLEGNLGRIVQEWLAERAKATGAKATGAIIKEEPLERKPGDDFASRMISADLRERAALAARWADSRKNFLAEIERIWLARKSVKNSREMTPQQKTDREFLLQFFRRCNGNVSRVARAMGCHPTRVHALFSRYGIDIKKRRLKNQP
jgi:DNA-binding NtrC family response regulator